MKQDGDDERAGTGHRRTKHSLRKLTSMRRDRIATRLKWAEQGAKRDPRDNGRVQPNISSARKD